MFDIGKYYEITLAESDGDVRMTRRVIDFEFPLLKLYSPYEPEIVINTTSQRFIQAQLSRHQGQRDDESDFA